MEKNKRIQKVIKCKLDNRFPTLRKIRLENHHKSLSKILKHVLTWRK